MDNSLNILIAEDEYIVLRGLKETLIGLGHKVIGEAMDGETFVKLALETDPDLLIVDVNLPALSGIEAIERIGKVKLVPSIIVTGYSSEETVKRANSAGVFNYLVKPVDEKELHEQEESLEARKLIERAKGILMDRNGIKESEAMKLLQKISRDRNLKLVVVAKEIIEADNTLHYGM